MSELTVLPETTGNAAVSAAEIARFNALASRWWDPSGPMRPLHAMNPARIGWIFSHITRRFPSAEDVRLLDIGCGAGLAAEALSRRGFRVLGIDAAPDVIDAARAHGGEAGPDTASPWPRICWRKGGAFR